MKRIVFIIITVTVVLAAYGQDSRALRDSLAAASEQLAYKPDSVHLRLKKAAWNVELQQWEYAKDEYDRVLRLDPDNPAALFYRAFVNEKLSRYGFARLDYEHLLQVVPNHFEGQLGYVLLNEKDNRHTEAMNQINRLAENFPDSAIVYAVRGGMEREHGLLSLAEDDFTEALRRDADNQDYLLSRADIYLQENKYQQAKQDLDRLVQLGVSRVALADFYLRLRRRP